MEITITVNIIYFNLTNDWIVNQISINHYDSYKKLKLIKRFQYIVTTIF